MKRTLGIRCIVGILSPSTVFAPCFAAGPTEADRTVEQFLLEAISSFSFLSHFTAIGKGVIEARDIIYFVSLILFWLFANTVFIDIRKAD